MSKFLKLKFIFLLFIKWLFKMIDYLTSDKKQIQINLELYFKFMNILFF